MSPKELRAHRLMAQALREAMRVQHVGAIDQLSPEALGRLGQLARNIETTYGIRLDPGTGDANVRPLRRDR